MGDRSMRSFFVGGIKYMRIYDPDTDDSFFIQPVLREETDFSKTELETVRRLHYEPDITEKMPKRLLRYPKTNGKV
jgi:hypothetical protein